jgi:ParB family chromosome partitioning protein
MGRNSKTFAIGNGEKMRFLNIIKEDIEPSGWNPRSKYDEEALNALKKSVAGVGLVEPIVVRPHSTKKGKYSIIAGEGRWDSCKKGELIPCVVRDESELDAKIICLVENYVREKVSDVDHEKFIADIYNEGMEQKKWKNYVQMSNATGIPDDVIGHSVSAFQDRTRLKLKSVDQRIVSTTDMVETRPLQDKPALRKKLLEKRAKGDVKASGHIMHEMATTLSKVPESVADAVLDDKIDYDDVKTRVDMLGGKQMPIEVAEDLVKKLADEKTQIKIGKKLSAELDTISIEEDEPADKHVKFKKSGDEIRLGVWEKRYRQFEMMTVHDINIIKNEKLRATAIQYLKRIREKCTDLLTQFNELPKIKSNDWEKK